MKLDLKVTGVGFEIDQVSESDQLRGNSTPGGANWAL
jgi:hypothetical protein